jgi:hypothetical protein
MSVNSTHRKRLARLLAAQSGLPYQQALDRVRAASRDRLLPSTLDDSGMQAALRVLTSAAPSSPPVPMFLIGGPYRSLVSDVSGHRVRPTCDLCQRTLDAGEPWWIVRAAGRDWAGEAGVACAQQSPASLPDVPSIHAPSGMQVWDLIPNLLVQTPAREVLKVSTIYPDRVTAQVVYPVPPRTTVREFTLADVATWREPSDVMVSKCERAWGFAR